MEQQKEKDAAQEISKAQTKKPRRRQRKTSPKAKGNGGTKASEREHVGTQIVTSRFKGSRTWFEFEIIIGKDTKRLKVHRVQIGRKPGENETEWARKSLGDNKIKNIVMEILKKERHLRPLEVPIFSESLFS